MKFLFPATIALIALLVVAGFAVADRLPDEVPENQIFTVDTVIDVTGAVDDKSTMAWIIASPGAIPNGTLEETQVIADVTYKDALLTNGGKIAENKNFGFDSQDQEEGLYNIVAEKVLTYAGTEGAHMIGEEEYTLSVAGNWDTTENDIRCVFSDNAGEQPAFCNIVSAKSSMVNVNSAQVSAKGQIRAVAEDESLLPAELNYQLAVTPDANSGSGFAEGTFKTTFAGSIMEARDVDDYEDAANWNKTSAENSWKDSTEVTGGIKNFQKALTYQSGFLL